MYRESDPEENERVALPVDERIHWPCMWMTEIYAPSQATSLISGLTKLERGVLVNPQAAHEEPSDWIQRAHLGLVGGGNVGLYVSDERAEFSREEVGLPNTFEEMSVELVQLAPGITVLVMMFMLSEAPLATGLEKVMRSTMETRAIPMRRRGSQRIQGPYHRKESDIADARDKVRADAREWIADQLPGLFSSLEGANPPAWDLLLSEKEQLHCDSLDYDEAWRGPLGLSAIREQSACEEVKGLQLVRPSSPESGAVPSWVGIRKDAEGCLTIPVSERGCRQLRPRSITE